MTDKHGLQIEINDSANLPVKIVAENVLNGVEMAVIEAPVDKEGSIKRFIVPATFLEKVAAVLLLLLLVGCQTGPQTAAYNSIAGAEQVAQSANAAYLDAVVTKQAPTNDVPTVEREFNLTQQALHAAALIAQAGTNGPVPPPVAAQVTTFTNLALTKIHK